MELAVLRHRGPGLVPVFPRLHTRRQGDLPPRHVAATRSPGGTGKDARWIDIHEDDLDEAQMATWVKQSAASPGWGRSRDRPGARVNADPDYWRFYVLSASQRTFGARIGRTDRPFSVTVS